MKVKQILHKALCVFGALLFSLLFVFQTAISPVKADENKVEYTNVLEDLQKDENFNVETYPAVADDYSMQVIQIAESVNKELFVYVYQPSAGVKDLTATTIRMSMPVVGVNSIFHDYSLTLLSTQGVFSKYKVEELTVKDDVVRYYDITAIHRLWDSEIDDELVTDTEQSINEVICEVVSLWRAETIDNTVIYSCTKSETIEVLAKVVGFIRYSNGFSLKADSCDSHLVAFTTDRQIDELQAARVGYKWRTERTYSNSEGFGISHGEWSKDEAYLKATDEVIQDGGWFGKRYEWNRIQKVSDILKEQEDLNLTSGTISDLNSLGDTAWVLRFFESDYNEEIFANLNYYDEKSIQVTDVTIIQLTFMTEGVPYNLGVLDNKQTGSKDPLGTADTKLDDFIEEMDKWWEMLLVGLAIILIGIALVFVVSVFGPILWPLIVAGVKWLVKAIATLFVWAFKGLCFLLCLPFRLIGKLFNRKDKYDGEDYET